MSLSLGWIDLEHVKEQRIMSGNDLDTDNAGCVPAESMTHERFVAMVVHNRVLLEGVEGQAIVPRRNPAIPTLHSHLVWMLTEAVHFHRNGKIQKANRWLGYVQGVMAMGGNVSLEALKRANMPEGEAFDPGET